MRFGGSTGELLAYGESVTGGSGRIGLAARKMAHGHVAAQGESQLLSARSGHIGEIREEQGTESPQTRRRLPSFPFVCPILTAAVVWERQRTSQS
jgi:hypothetical protein